MSLFKNIKEAKASRGANYVRAGNYIALIRRVKLDKTRKGIEFVAVEMVNLATISTDPSEPAHREGEHMSKLFMSNQDTFLGNIKAFISNVMAVPEDQVDEEACMEIVGDDQPLAGVIVELSNKVVMTREGKPFTLVNFAREVSAPEVLEKVGEETLKRLLTAEELEIFAASLEEEKGSKD